MGEAIIIGIGGQGKVVLDILQEQGVKVKGFVDDDPKWNGKSVNDVPCLGDFEALVKRRFAEDVVVAIGSNAVRKKLFEACKAEGFNLINAVHPKAIISKRVELGKGVVIMPGATVNTNTVIGDNIIINTNASVDHDSILENHCQIQPGATIAGTVTIKESATIGSGATVLPNLTVGKNSFVGAGAVVTKDVINGILVVGIPAKEMERRSA